MDLMIDLETLGTTPGCMIGQIGLAFFERHGHDVRASHSLPLDLWEQERLGFRVEIDTLRWWSQRDGPLREHVMFSGTRLSRAQALGTLNSLHAVYDVRAVWAHGAAFDFPILRELARHAGGVPWSFRKEMDTRTLFRLTGDSRPAETAHDARQDAVEQALAVQREMAGLRESEA